MKHQPISYSLPSHLARVGKTRVFLDSAAKAGMRPENAYLLDSTKSEEEAETRATEFLLRIHVQEKDWIH
jgi:hypothetical protein